MTIYVALLRGINVGGHNKVKMAELRSMFESIGLNRVQKYIQTIQYRIYKKTLLLQY